MRVLAKPGHTKYAHAASVLVGNRNEIPPHSWSASNNRTIYVWHTQTHIEYVCAIPNMAMDAGLSMLSLLAECDSHFVLQWPFADYSCGQSAFIMRRLDLVVILMFGLFKGVVYSLEYNISVRNLPNSTPATVCIRNFPSSIQPRINSTLPHFIHPKSKRYA